MPAVCNVAVDWTEIGKWLLCLRYQCLKRRLTSRGGSVHIFKTEMICRFCWILVRLCPISSWLKRRTADTISGGVKLQCIVIATFSSAIRVVLSAYPKIHNIRRRVIQITNSTFRYMERSNLINGSYKFSQWSDCWPTFYTRLIGPPYCEPKTHHGVFVTSFIKLGLIFYFFLFFFDFLE